MRHVMGSGHGEGHGLSRGEGFGLSRGGHGLGRGGGRGAAHEAPRQRTTAAPDAANGPTAAQAAVETDPATTRALIWRLQSGGWTDIEAGNLAAIALGLKP